MNSHNNNDKGVLWPMLLAFAAGVTAVLMTDENRRKRFKEVVDDTLNKSKKMKKDLSDTLNETAATGRRKIAKEMEKTAQKISS